MFVFDRLSPKVCKYSVLSVYSAAFFQLEGKFHEESIVIILKKKKSPTISRKVL